MHLIYRMTISTYTSKSHYTVYSYISAVFLVHKRTKEIGIVRELYLSHKLRYVFYSLPYLSNRLIRNSWTHGYKVADIYQGDNIKQC